MPVISCEIGMYGWRTSIRQATASLLRSCSGLLLGGPARAAFGQSQCTSHASSFLGQSCVQDWAERQRPQRAQRTATNACMRTCIRHEGHWGRDAWHHAWATKHVASRRNQQPGGSMTSSLTAARGASRCWRSSSGRQPRRNRPAATAGQNTPVQCPAAWRAQPSAAGQASGFPGGCCLRVCPRHRCAHGH